MSKLRRIRVKLSPINKEDPKEILDQTQTGLDELKLQQEPGRPNIEPIADVEWQAKFEKLESDTKKAVGERLSAKHQVEGTEEGLLDFFARTDTEANSHAIIEEIDRRRKKGTWSLATAGALKALRKIAALPGTVCSKVGTMLTQPNDE